MGTRLVSLTAAVAAAVVTPPAVTSVPGLRLPVSAAQRRAGTVEVRRVLVAGTGARAVSLLVGRTRDGRLCVGAGAFFRCLRPLDAQPVYVLGRFRATWGAVVGLAGPEVSRVTIALQQNERHVLTLRRLPHFRWRAFSFPPTGPNGRLPSFVLVEGRGGSRAVSVGLGWIYGKTGDSPDMPVGEARPRMERAKEIALRDAHVGRLLGAATRVVDAPAPWTGCGGKPIGAIVTVELFRPIAVDDDLPFVSFKPVQRTRAYAEGVLHLEADGITELDVGVDLDRGRVISIDPSGDHVRLHAYRIVRRAVPAGRPVRGGCPPRKPED